MKSAAAARSSIRFGVSSKEGSVGWNKWIRQFHRWLSIIFTVVVAAIFVAKGMGKEPANWMYLTPLPPLALLVLSGLYLFVLPYANWGLSVRKQP